MGLLDEDETLDPTESWARTALVEPVSIHDMSAAIVAKDVFLQHRHYSRNVSLYFVQVDIPLLV